MPPTKNASGLGKALINRKHKDAQQRRDAGNYATDPDPTSKLQSVTQERNLDEFLNTAQLANTDFTAEKQNIRVIQAPDVGVSSAHNPFLLSAQDEKKTLQRHFENKGRLRVPRRPPWTKDMTSVQLDRQEKDAFLEWRRGIAELSDNEGFLLTPFERNIEVWRQLWRVLERSHLVIQIVDARNPLRFRCEDLEAYVTDIEGSEGEKGTGKGKRRSLLLINKADLLTRTQRITWADYFDANGVRFAFYSAANASALQELPGQTEGQEPDSEDQPPPDSTEAELDEEGSQNGEKSHEIKDSEEEESDPRIRVLTVRELEELFVKSAPPLTDFVDSAGQPPEKLMVGLVGYPNVGKSSTINSLLGAKKVSVSSTPGKTKHFQTIQLTPGLVLCDCPGLVFPQFATTKADLVCDGVLPIDQMREYRGPAGLVTKRISRAVLEATYGLTIPSREDTIADDEILAEELLVAYAIARGYVRAGQGNPDEARAARYILKDYVNAKLLYCHPPPDMSRKEFNKETMEIQLKTAMGTKKAPLTRVGKNADTAPDVFYDDESLDVQDQEGEEGGEPKPRVHASSKSRAIDRDFFDSQAVGSRPFIKGGAKDGQSFSRVKVYPHQNSIADDGKPLESHQANAAAILESSGIRGDSGKKHFKMKKAKQRSGKGYD